MNDIGTLMLACVAGLLLGAIFFGGLWWTVRRGLVSHHPALWFLGSLALRMGLALAGFYWVGHGDGMRLMACLLGFLIARLAVTWLTWTSSASQPDTTQEVHHASQSR